MGYPYYSAVAGDPLDSGPGSYVIDNRRHQSSIEGPDGVMREMATIGDDAYCSRCKSIGKIIGGAGVRSGGRMLFSDYGCEQAVGGDQVQCQCPTNPRIVATYGMHWEILDHTGGSSWYESARNTFMGSPWHTHDEQFLLCDANGAPMPNTYYTVRLASGAVEHGTTDWQGRTARYSTDNAESIQIYIGHKEVA